MTQTTVEVSSWEEFSNVVEREAFTNGLFHPVPSEDPGSTSLEVKYIGYTIGDEERDVTYFEDVPYPEELSRYDETPHHAAFKSSVRTAFQRLIGLEDLVEGFEFKFLNFGGKEITRDQIGYWQQELMYP